MHAEEDRSKNLVVFGVTEGDGESVKSKLSDLLDIEQLDEEPEILDSTRIGQHEAGSTSRPIKFRVKSSETAFQILRKAKRLKDIDGCKTIYILMSGSAVENLSASSGKSVSLIRTHTISKERVR